MLVWSFLTIFLVVDFGAGEIYKLIVIGVRSYWRVAQFLAWFGLAVELVALSLVWSAHWRKLAYVGTACLFFSAALFLFRAHDFRFLNHAKVRMPIGIFIGSCILRLMQLRRKPAAVPAKS